MDDNGEIATAFEQLRAQLTAAQESSFGSIPEIEPVELAPYLSRPRAAGSLGGLLRAGVASWSSPGGRKRSAFWNAGETGLLRLTQTLQRCW